MRTRELLREFAEQGGKLVTNINDLPSISPPHRDIAVTLREGNGFTLVFAVNFSRDADYTGVKIGENLRGTAYEYDARENKIVRVCNASSLTADFVRKQERIFLRVLYCLVQYLECSKFNLVHFIKFICTFFAHHLT